MAKVVFVGETDDAGDVWIDIGTPFAVFEEKSSPHRLAVKTKPHSTEGGDADIWMRFPRTDAYQLVDQLQAALTRSQETSESKVRKVTKVRLPLNGGVNTETGDMILLFQGNAGLEHQLEVPFDQSGMMLEILERATKQAGSWSDEKAKLKSESGASPMNLQARATEYVMLAVDAVSQRPILVVRLEGGHQFSFMLDQQIVERLRAMRLEPEVPRPATTNPWSTVADDIEWLRREWCTIFAPPREDEIRRGSAALRRLLLEDSLGKAWRHFGFERQPRISGPNVLKLLEDRGVELRHVVSLIAGGGTVNGLQMALIGSARAGNASTGVPADADEGFAVAVISICRDARSGPATTGELLDLVEYPLPLTSYRDAVGAIRLGDTISRANVIRYFAHVAGGAHFDPGMSSVRGDPTPHLLVRDLESKVKADLVEGLHFELLSIGQAIGRSTDLELLTKRIREA